MLWAISGSDLHAQIFTEPDLVGEFELLMDDGSPIVEGWDFTAEIGPPVPTLGVRFGRVYVNKNDGNGQQEIVGEQLFIHETRDGYYWENARGNTGITVWNKYEGYFENTVLTGPNTGAQRRVVPLPS